MKFQTLLFLSLLGLLAACNGGNAPAEEAAETTPAPEPEGVRVSSEELFQLGIDTASQIPQGLRVGQPAPDFEGFDQNGRPIRLQEALQAGPVVLIFYRGFWCGVCNRYLSQFADSLELVRQAGATVIAVAPETAENARKTVEKTGFEVPVLSDSTLQIMNAYGVTFHVNEDYQQKIVGYAGTSIAATNGAEDAFLPVPATYVIAPDGNIHFAHFNPNYRQRASVHDILDALNRLQRG
ncbi:MAG: AhpC/TSA family protein [Bacteroidetes bacterium]|nr:MAG: AhpC/TSA family protein [Bacteroidota bacterium]